MQSHDTRVSLIAQRLEHYLDVTGFPKREICRQTGLSPNTIDNLLRPHVNRKVPNGSTVQKLSEFMERVQFFDGFSKVARDAITQNIWLYFHKTNVAPGVSAWKQHELTFAYRSGLFVARTKSVGPRGEALDTRYFRYLLYGSDSRLFVYGKRVDSGHQEWIDEDLDGPGERIFPVVQFPISKRTGKLLAGKVIFAGIGIWTDWSTPPSPVLSRCLLTTSTAMKPTMKGTSFRIVSGSTCQTDIGERLDTLWIDRWSRTGIKNMLDP